MPNENLRRYMDKDSLEALWNDTGQLISNLVESAAQGISDVAVQQAQAAADDSIRDAIEAVEDISELVVPLMSDVVRGGAKLGSGLEVEDGTLSLGNLVTDSHDGPIYSVDAEGWSEQVQTVGKNLLNKEAFVGDSTTSVTQFANGFRLTTINATTYSGLPLMVIPDLTSYVGQTITLSGRFTTTSNSLIALQSKKNNVEILWKAVSTSSFSITQQITSEFEGAYLRVYAYANGNSGTTGDYTDFEDVQLEFGSTPTSYEPYSGAKPSPSPEFPQTIEVCRGRNLLDKSGITNGQYFDSSGNLVSGSEYSYSGYIPVSAGKNYVASGFGLVNGVYAVWYDSAKTKLSTSLETNYTFNLAAPANAAYVRLSLRAVSTYQNPQLELGSTPTPYVPFGHVGLDIYDANNAHVSTVPIPLPSKGWAGGLPDGTADELSIDSAGKWEWTNKAWELVFDGSSDENWFLENSGARVSCTYMENHGIGIKWPSTSGVPLNALCTHFLRQTATNTWLHNIGISGQNNADQISISDGTNSMTVDSWRSWLTSNPITVLYELATPTTEHGYVDLPMDIPVGASIDIPELRECNVKCFVPGAKELAIHAANWGQRAKEQESRIAALEAAVAELATS